LAANFLFHIVSAPKTIVRRFAASGPAVIGGSEEEKTEVIKQLSWRRFMLAGGLAVGAGSTAAQATDCSGALAPGQLLFLALETTFPPSRGRSNGRIYRCA
jgi:hypothetical protein